MDLDSGVIRVADQLRAAAALGDERTHQIAAALAATAAPAVRLALIEALTAAAQEISAALLDVPGAPAVSVHLDGDRAVVDVRTTETGPTRDHPAVPAATDEGADPAGDADAGTARISLRLGAPLKARVDAAAAEDGISVNTWLVRAATRALHERPAARRRPDPRRITGWIN